MNEKKIAVDKTQAAETQAAESLVDMVVSARMLRKHTGESVEAILRQSALNALTDRFDRYELCEFIDMLAEITDEIDLLKEEILFESK